MAFKIRVKSPTLRELVEFQDDKAHSIYPVPFGKLSDMGKVVIKRAVPWKKVKGEAYKTVKTKDGKNLYNEQQTKVKEVRTKVASKIGTNTGGVAVVMYADGEYGIVPKLDAYMSMNKLHDNKPVITEVVYEATTKEQALNYLKGIAAKQVEELALA